MKLAEIFKRTSVEVVMTDLIDLYQIEDTLKDHIYAYGLIKGLTPTTSNLSIRLSELTDPDDVMGECVEVVGVDLGGELWALGYTDWTEWLAMEVEGETVRNFTDSEIVAHCLWEMTFFGYTPGQVQAAKDELDTAFAEAMANKDKWMSMEDLFKDLGNEHQAQDN